MGFPCLVLAADPFQVSVRMDDGRRTTDDRPEKAENRQRMLSVQVDVPPHHKLYADQFSVEAPAPVRLIARFLPAPEKQADPLIGETKLVITQSFKALYAVESLNTNPLPVTVRWQGCDETVCFLPAAK